MIKENVLRNDFVFHSEKERAIAETAITKQITLQGENDVLLTQLGMIHLDRKMYDHAERYFTTALQITPNSLGAQLGLLDCYFAQYLFEKASSLLEVMSKSSCISLEHIIHKKRAVLKRLQRQFTLSLDICREAIQYRPGDPYAHHLLGLSFKDTWKFKSAEECFLRAIELDETFEEGVISLTQLLSEQERYEEARDYLAKMSGGGFSDPWKVELEGALIEFRDQNWTTACEMFTSIISNYTDNCTIHLRFGQIAARMNRIEVATEQLNIAEGLDPYRYDVKFAQSEMLRNVGKTEKAKALLEEIKKSKLSAVEWKIALEESLILKTDNRHRESYTILSEALSCSIESDILLYNLGVTYRESGDSINAEKCLQQVIEINPYYFDAYLQLIALYREQRLFDDAEKIIASVEALDVEGTRLNRLLIERSANFRMQDKYEQSRDALAAISGDHATGQAKNLQEGITFYMEKRSVKAEMCFRKSLQSRSNHVESMFWLAKVLRDQYRFDESEEIYNNVKELDVDNVSLWRILLEQGVTFRLRRKYQKALQCFRQSMEKVEIPSSLAKIHLQVGITCVEMKDFTQAAQEFYTSIDYEPWFEEAYLNLSRLMALQGRYDQADAVIQQYEKVCNGSSLYKKYMRQAINYRIWGKHASSLSSLETGIEEFGQVAELVFQKGISLFLRNETQQALAIFTGLVDSNPYWTDAALFFSKCLARTGKRGKALEVLNDLQVRVDHHEKWRIHVEKALMYFNAKNANGGVEQFEAAIEASNMAEAPTLQITKHLERNKQYFLALKCYEKLLSTDPECDFLYDN